MYDRELKHSAGSDRGREPSSSYLRLMLALSVALLLHTLVAVLMAAPTLLPEPDRAVRMQLVLKGVDQSLRGEPSVADTAAPATTESTAIKTTAESEPRTAEPASPDSELPVNTPNRVHTVRDTQIEITEASEASLRSPREESRDTSPAKSGRPSEPDTPPIANSAGLPALPSAASSPRGNDAPQTDTEATDRKSKIRTLDLPKLDPYREALLAQITEEVDSSIVRNLDTLERVNRAVGNGPRKIIIELWLLENGAVRRVRLVERSGDEWIDGVAERAALAASPYPPPPEDKRQGDLRFQLPLIITPPDFP